MSVADQSTSLPRLGLLLIALLSLFWGFNWPMMKIALSEVPPLVFRTLCLTSGAIGLLALARLGGHSLAIPRRELRPVVLASFFNITLWNVCIAYGVQLVPAGRAAILAYSMPLWGIVLGALVLGERLTMRGGFALVVGLAGMAVLMGGDLGVLTTAPLGALLVLGGAVSWAIGTVLLKYYRPSIPTVALAGWQLAIGGAPIFVAALLFDLGNLAPVGPGPVLATLYNMLVCFIFCYWAWFKIVGMVPVAASGLGTLMIPVIGVFSSALVLDEAIGLQEVLSLGLVVVALAAVLTRPAARTRADAD